MCFRWKYFTQLKLYETKVLWTKIQKSHNVWQIYQPKPPSLDFLKIFYVKFWIELFSRKLLTCSIKPSSELFCPFLVHFADFNSAQRKTLGGSTPQASYEVVIIRGCRIVKLNLGNINYTVNIYLIKVNKRNTRKKCEICSNLTVKTPERRHWHRSGVFAVNFEHILHLFLVFLLLTLNK